MRRPVVTEGVPLRLVGDLREAVLEARGLAVTAAGRPLLRGIELKVPARQVLGLIGPSGAGKTTLLRCLNRLSDLSPALRVRGEVRFHGRDVYAPGTDVDALRARVGIVFQQPVVFPCSVLENVVFGARRLQRLPRRRWPGVAEAALREAALWEEVKDRLQQPAQALSVGQQQRLCLARTLAVGPEVILMDEPTSALDARAAEAIEELVRRLKQRHAIVLVTHNLGQAQRLADGLICLGVRDGVGEVVETAGGDTLLDRPADQEVGEFLRRP
jgi:phosphate transport system ATP-binding protein